MDPFADADYEKGRTAQEAGDLKAARSHFELAVSRGNPVALLELIEVCFELGDVAAAKAHASDLQARAQSSAEISYVTSKAFEHGACLDIFGMDAAHEKRKEYLVRAAELGNPIAQIEVAANFAYGTNNFAKDLAEFSKWINRAAKDAPVEAARCFVDVAQLEGMPVPQWASRALRPA